MAELQQSTELVLTPDSSVFAGFGLGLIEFNFLAHVGFATLGLSYLTKQMTERLMRAVSRCMSDGCRVGTPASVMSYERV